METNTKIANLSPTHEQMLNWLVLNPEKSQRELADHFGFTQSWVSSILHSDLFQAALKEKQGAIFSMVAASIPAKLARAADLAIEGLTTQIEGSQDKDFLLDATDKILHRMGYAPQSARAPAGSPVNQQNNFFISAADLNEARDMMQANAQRLSPPVLIEGETLP
jgi:hypothetical protein